MLTPMSRGARTLGCVVLLGCGSTPSRVPETQSGKAEAPRAAACSSVSNDAKHLVAVGHQGSAVALARSGDRLLAYVANREAKRLDVVDVKARSAIGTIALQGSPEQVLVLADGRLVVSLEDRAALETLSIGANFLSFSPERECLIDVPPGPGGLAVSEDGATLVVASEAARTVTVLDPATMTPRGHVSVARSPKSVLVEGTRAFVSHVAGDQLSVLDLTTPNEPRTIDLGMLPASQVGTEDALKRKRRSAQGYSLVSVEIPPQVNAERPPISGIAPRRRIIAPQVSVDPGDAIRSAIYYGPPPVAGIGKETPVVLSVDADSERRQASHVLSFGQETFVRECLLPRAAAVRASTSRLYVACRGIDEMLELDALASDPMRQVLRRFDLSKGVTGMAIADEEGLGVAFGEFDGRLDIVRLADGLTSRVDLSEHGPTLSSSYRSGRELFYRSNDPRISFDGLSCASCHPDGGEDGLTWSTPEGPRQTPMLAGRLHGTAPYGWTREIGTLPEYIQNTVQRLGGTGLAESERAALASYLERMPAPEPQLARSDVARGRALFTDQGCTSCHEGKAGTDNKTHELLPNLGGAIDTPSLRFVGLTAPYFHDGRYKTMDELLADPESSMGTTAKLSPGDRKHLASFLESL